MLCMYIASTAKSVLVKLERCNLWPHVANRHISGLYHQRHSTARILHQSPYLRQRLSQLWCHSRYDVIDAMPSITDTLPRLIYRDFDKFLFRWNFRACFLSAYGELFSLQQKPLQIKKLRLAWWIIIPKVWCNLNCVESAVKSEPTNQHSLFLVLCYWYLLQQYGCWVTDRNLRTWCCSTM